ncbi:hypothetical protein ACOSQ4_027656 [Xanthoceras sorbifolium]
MVNSKVKRSVLLLYNNYMEDYEIYWLTESLLTSLAPDLQLFMKTLLIRFLSVYFITHTHIPADVVGPRFTAVHEDSAHQVRHMFDEIDYILKGKHIKRFASLYGSYPRKP